MKSISFVFAVAALSGAFAAECPRVWTSYSNVYGLEKDLTEMRAKGVDVADLRGDRPLQRRRRLAAYRAAGMKGCLSVRDITGNGKLIEEYGLMPEPALMIGGAYRGKAIDRAVFDFTASKHKIVVEPPVYNQVFPFYHRETRTEEGAPRGELMAHYYPAVEPIRAEVVVPLADYDGRQHIKIVPARLALAPEGAVPEKDTISKPEWKDLWEVRHRKLVTVEFDLTGLDGAQLDKVGVAVYWTIRDQDEHNMFRHGQVAPGAPTTVEVAVREMKRFLNMWKVSNGGAFPSDVVVGLRLGDECFNPTGHLNGPAVNYPMWNYSASGVRGFAALAKPGETYPRVAGRPDIYGRDAYGCWLYNYHRQCADLVAAQVKAAHEVAPDLIVLRNTTRGGSWSRNNDHDGSAQELLTAALDAVNLDPYPVTAAGFNPEVIPMDMAYNVGLSRRYGKFLVPWMQAHCYGGPSGLVDVTPAQVDRMTAQQYAAAPDGIMWLGYGATFPLHNPESWLAAARFHKRLHREPPKRGRVRLAVLRDYAARAVRADVVGGIRNPADAMLESFCRQWAVVKGQPYDVFEVPPRETESEKTARDTMLKNYEFVVSTMPCPGAVVLGVGTDGLVADKQRQREFAAECAALVEKLVGSVPDCELNARQERQSEPVQPSSAGASYLVADLAYRRIAYYRSNDLPGGAADDRYKTRYLLFRRLPGAQALWAGVYPVTQYQWVLVKNRNPSCFQNLDCWAKRPVENVSFEMVRGPDEALSPDGFLFALRKMFGGAVAFDLPTEAEWEALARAGEKGLLPGGASVTEENVRKIARNFGYVQFPRDCTVAEGGTAEVGSFPPNAFGLYDTLGNVFEFCRTWYAPGRRVIRGGACNSPIGNCTFGFRAGEDPRRQSMSRGFRLVVSEF